MAEIKRYRVTLDIQWEDEEDEPGFSYDPPTDWDWHTILDLGGPFDTVRVVECAEMSTLVQEDLWNPQNP